MWAMKYLVEHPKRKNKKAFTDKMKAVNLQINAFLKCGPGVTCRLKRLIFSLGISFGEASFS